MIMASPNTKQYDSKQRDYSFELEMLKFYQQEFQYRINHLWNILIKLFFLCVIVCLIPFVSEIVGIKFNIIDNNTNVALVSLFFPSVGFFISIFSWWILRNETQRMNVADDSKANILEKLPQAYRYCYGNSRKSNSKPHSISKKLYWFASAFELLLSICSLLACIFLKR